MPAMILRIILQAGQILGSRHVRQHPCVFLELQLLVRKFITKLGTEFRIVKRASQKQSVPFRGKGPHHLIQHYDGNLGETGAIPPVPTNDLPGQWKQPVDALQGGLFIKRELGCKAYLRYVDDFALFSSCKVQLWEWKQAIRERLSHLRLRFHETSAQVIPTSHGIPWLGFVIYPKYRRVRRRKVVEAHRRLSARYDRWQRGEISFAEFDASVQGWINHVRYADSWGLRRHVLQGFVW